MPLVQWNTTEIICSWVCAGLSLAVKKMIRRNSEIISKLINFTNLEVVREEKRESSNVHMPSCKTWSVVPCYWSKMLQIRLIMVWINLTVTTCIYMHIIDTKENTFAWAWTCIRLFFGGYVNFFDKKVFSESLSMKSSSWYMRNITLLLLLVILKV